MSSSLSPGKVLLLAAHYATHGDIESLARLSSQRDKVLHKELLLRILLTYLPETVKPSAYVGFLLALAGDHLEEYSEGGLDTTPVDDFSKSTGSISIPFAGTVILDYVDRGPKLSDPAAVLYLLSRTGSREDDRGFIGRDIRGLVGPWLQGKSRWASKSTSGEHTASDTGPAILSAGWEQFLEWLVGQATTSWTVAVAVAEQWGGPRDLDLGEAANLELTESQQQYLLRSYVRAVLASAYLVSEATVGALPGAYQMASKMRRMLGYSEDQREQKGEIAKLIRSAATKVHGDEDTYWSQIRDRLLWLNNWGYDGDQSTNSEAIRGIIGAVPKEFIETEILKALLSNSRYTLAKSIYEDDPKQPLASEIIQDTVYQAALRAFDNASNPNRSRGGLKKCDEIIHSFPKTLTNTHPATKRQGEPFKPVVLRVHSDPVSIIDKVLEQNPKAYTRLPEFLEMAANMVRAGITQQARSVKLESTTGDNSKELIRAEKFITALCIEAALREDDFETAYSYVVSRLETTASNGTQERSNEEDEWSWKAALKAGQYIRTERTLLPTHLGIASGNPEIRHLEQRIECLATALRVAPTSQLQEILKTFRRCEEQLDSAISEEAAAEASWASAGEVPGAFESSASHNLQSTRNMTATAAAKQAEEAPMSLFDLSRATASVAQRNFTKLSSLSSLATSRPSAPSPTGEQAPQRLRKRDQLREAATGTLVSGVGWLIGASVNREQTET
ncbi:hypothetical protein TrVFT333_011489 [Trichoderma virens FT-333]|nr:hypothetical protein TrVFT333_011489 [Trichoderma virens FT-333]